MTALITGGVGVSGNMTTKKFAAEGHRPVVVARNRDPRLIAGIEDEIDVELVDVRDLPRLTSVMQTYGVTHVAHRAALVGTASNANPPASVPCHGPPAVALCARGSGRQLEASPHDANERHAKTAHFITPDWATRSSLSQHVVSQGDVSTTETMLAEGGEEPTLFLWATDAHPTLHPSRLPTQRPLEKHNVIRTGAPATWRPGQGQNGG